MSESSAPVNDTLEQSVDRLLRTVPETWTEYDAAALSEFQERALYLLTAAGMIERRATLRLRMFGHSVAAEATITLTGEGGFAEAMKYVLADMWSDWHEIFERYKSGEEKDAPASHCERIGKEQWRLTTQGVVARHDLDTGGQSMVFDFVLKRGFFDGRPRLMPDGRISQRFLVAGKGTLERFRRVKSDADPAAVNIANWAEGAQAFAVALAELFKASETQAAAPAKPAAPHPPGQDKPSPITPDSLDENAVADALAAEGYTLEAAFVRHFKSRQTSTWQDIVEAVCPGEERCWGTVKTWATRVKNVLADVAPHCRLTFRTSQRQFLVIKKTLPE